MLRRTGQDLIKGHCPAAIARAGKRIVARPRSWQRKLDCRRGFREHGDRYRHPVLFIAGLPKSGTTWLERMVSSFPGFNEYLIPEVTSYEMRVGHSHDYDLPADVFRRFEGMLVLSKMHVHGSRHNVQLLRDANVPYVVLFRDLRDVAVSFVHYVRRTPWHPEHRVYRGRGVQEGLALFCRRTLAAYADWVTSWHVNSDPALGLMVRYEDLHSDTVGQMNAVARHFGLDDSGLLDEIIEEHSFSALQSAGGFYRKGIVGDWRNHFTPDLCAMYDEIIGDYLTEYGYEPMPERPERRRRSWSGTKRDRLTYAVRPVGARS